MMNLIKEILLCLPLIVIFIVTQGETQELDPPPTTKHCEKEIVKKLFAIAKEKYPHLELDEKLCVGSQRWADHLAKTGQFKHDKNVAENIARGYRSCKSCMQGWFRSRGHNAQFRSRKFVGFGEAVSRNGQRIWVSRFR